MRKIEKKENDEGGVQKKKNKGNEEERGKMRKIEKEENDEGGVQIKKKEMKISVWWRYKEEKEQ